MCANARFFVTTLTLGVALLLGACADLPTGPAPVEVVPVEVAPQGKLLEHVEYEQVNFAPQLLVLEREEALEEVEEESDFIGPEGGEIELDDAGLTIYFPRGALLSRTKITVVAPAGKLVGYDFYPHGLVFQKSVWVIQDLDDTNVSLGSSQGQSFVAAYHEGELSASVIGKELRPLWNYGPILVFTIKHFSGYVVATD